MVTSSQCATNSVGTAMPSQRKSVRDVNQAFMTVQGVIRGSGAESSQGSTLCCSGTVRRARELLQFDGFAISKDDADTAYAIF